MFWHASDPAHEYFAGGVAPVGTIKSKAKKITKRITLVMVVFS
jgi:hypothetical protein